MRDLAVLFLHLIVPVARLAGPGGARSVVTRIHSGQAATVDPQSFPETVAKSARNRSHCCRLVCSPHPSRQADSFGYRIEAVNSLALPSSTEEPKVPLVVLAQATEEAGPKATQPGGDCSGRPNETTESHLGLSSDRSTDRAGFRHSNQQRRRASDSGCSLPA